MKEFIYATTPDVAKLLYIRGWNASSYQLLPYEGENKKVVLQTAIHSVAAPKVAVITIGTMSDNYIPQAPYLVTGKIMNMMPKMMCASVYDNADNVADIDVTHPQNL